MMLPTRTVGHGLSCPPPAVDVAVAVLSFVDGTIAAVAVLQLLRIHLWNRNLGWTRQKMFHLMIGFSNVGYFIYFIACILATCQRWPYWSHGLGFLFMACPQLLCLAAFLLLLSFWVDVCHQTNDEEEEDGQSFVEPLLDKPKTGLVSGHADRRRGCCTIPRISHIGSRQRFVLVVIFLTFVFMIAFAILIWVGRGKNHVDSSLVARVYLDVFSVAIFILGGALCGYGFILFSKMREVRSDMISSEMWKVVGLAAVSLVCFTSSSVLALFTNIPLQMLSHWQSEDADTISSSIFIFLYYFVGSSIPSSFVLWFLREMPRRLVHDRPPQATVVTILRDGSAAATHHPQWRNSVTSAQNKVLKASPI